MKHAIAPALLFAVALTCLPYHAMAQSSAIRQKLAQDQEEAYGRLGWSMPRYRQADLDARVQRHQEENISQLTGRPGTTAEYDARVMEEILSRVQTMRAKGLLQLPTGYEDPQTYLELAILTDQIETGIQRTFGKDLIPRPVFGTLPTGEVDASVRQESGGYLVAFDSGLFKFADHLSGILALSLPLEGQKGTWFKFSTDRDAIRRHLDSNPAVVARLQTIVRAYVVGGAPALTAAPDAPRLREPFEQIARNLYRGMLLFVLGHEYGHIVTIHQRLSPGDKLPPQWDREVAADGWGVLLSMAASDGATRNAAATIWGMKVFLTCYELIERSVATLATGTETSRRHGQSHPPTELRLQYLPNHFRVVATRFTGGLVPPSPEEVESAIRESKGLDAITELLWERLKPNLVTLHTLGVRPDPVWTSAQ